MSVQNASLTSAPSSYTITGGTALAFSSMGPAVDGAAVLVATADTDLRTRRSLRVASKPARVSPGAPNGYTQERRTLTFYQPIALANGKYTVNTVQVTMAYDIEAAAAKVTELRDLVAQALGLDSDFADFWTKGSLA